MQKKLLGKTDLLVSPIAFGGNVFGWTINEQTSFEILDAFVASDFNFVDTADMYSRWASGIGGESETILGSWMKKRGNRKEIILATKVGKDMGNGKIGLSKKYILNAVNDSLKRLQTDYIDLYQSHDDDSKTPLEETLDAYQYLIKEGKVRYIGASNYSAERLNLALETSRKYNYPRYQTLQPHYNLMERNIFETDLEKVCLDNKLGVIPYFSLASGFLSGKYRNASDRTKSVRGSVTDKYLNEKGLNVLNALDEVSSKHETKPASVALAWLMARPSITSPIASATTIEQLKDLVNAASIVLDAKDIELLNSSSI
ncbi:aldo/keto reductase [Aurantibacillus circumpalustris]|uniref:aldo/keto reductase n=1 Tax=Aurantibacillus circumpalustris TaxID=3036359 RepID=UPI00295A87CF|nr:aldo/keto reductase [Aurantibacillus circumpalustris]